MSSPTDELTPVLAAYRIQASSVRPAGGTAGRSWQVTEGNRRWFIRRRGGRTATVQRAEYDHGLRNWLAANGFPATPARPGPDGLPWLELNAQLYEVYPWVDGVGLSPELAERCRVPAAVTLAWFHRLAADYPNLCEPALPQFGHYPTPPRATARFDDPVVLGEVVDQLRQSYGTSDNAAAFAQAAARVEQYQQAYGELRESLPTGVIHGDYNGCNLLFEPSGEVAGVFDYDWAWQDSRVRDVGEGVFFFGARREAPPDGGSIWSLTACPRFDFDAMVAFGRAYHQAYALTHHERRAVPLALLGRWLACRTEGVMKVPVERRAEFFLADLDQPFAWYDAFGETFVAALA